MAKKLTLVILGILIIAIFELSLYFTGRVFIYLRNCGDQLSKSETAKQIVCIGDSHTFGVGAWPKYSYPKQLEALLNLNNPKTMFKVVNLGIPGDSTKHQIERLANYLSKNKTDLVILLTGRNNYFEIKTLENKSLISKIIICIQKLRIYKVLQYVLCQLFKIKEGENINAAIEITKYEDYMRQRLLKAKYLCEKNHSKLILLSYFNTYDLSLQEIAKQFGILYFNIVDNFFEAIPYKNRNNFISRDMSHMNQYGYKIFAEILYEQMFLHRAELGLTINSLSKRINQDKPEESPFTSLLRYLQGKSVFY